MKELLWELRKVLGNFEATSGDWGRHTNYGVGDGMPPAYPIGQMVGFPALDDSRKLYRIIRRLRGSAQTILYWLSEASSISGKTNS